MKGLVDAVVISCKNDCKKMKLPNGKVVDILSNVLDSMEDWVQDSNSKFEAGGYIVGYQHSETGNITLEDISTPYPLDKRSYTSFVICDSRHSVFLAKKELEKSYYMGVWHTHPQNRPVPSLIDWSDWNETLNIDQTACEYAFFIIVGNKELRVWVGDFKSKVISEIFECPKIDGTYVKN